MNDLGFLEILLAGGSDRLYPTCEADAQEHATVGGWRRNLTRLDSSPWRNRAPWCGWADPVLRWCGGRPRAEEGACRGCHATHLFVIMP